MRQGIRARRLSAALAALVLLAVAVLFAKVGGGRTAMVTGHRQPDRSPPMIALVWRSVGSDVDPWSGAGLEELVRRALAARGVAVRRAEDTQDAAFVADVQGLASLGRRLDVAYTLGGTVGRRDQRSEIGMQLIRVRDGSPVWSSTFWRDQGDLESLPSELATVVSEILRTETNRSDLR
jgi:TolB-like protein